MLKWLTPDPIKKMNKEYARLTEKAMLAQRNGDIKSFARLSTEADKLLKEIENLKKITEHNIFVNLLIALHNFHKNTRSCFSLNFLK